MTTLTLRTFFLHPRGSSGFGPATPVGTVGTGGRVSALCGQRPYRSAATDRKQGAHHSDGGPVRRGGDH